MQQFINQYSFAWFAALCLLLLAFLLLRQKSKARGFIILIVVTVGLVVTWLVLRPTQTPLMDNAQKVQSLIGQGTPVLLEFQSPY